MECEVGDVEEGSRKDFLLKSCLSYKRVLARAVRLGCGPSPASPPCQSNESKDTWGTPEGGRVCSRWGLCPVPRTHQYSLQGGVRGKCAVLGCCLGSRKGGWGHSKLHLRNSTTFKWTPRGVIPAFLSSYREKTRVG